MASTHPERMSEQTVFKPHVLSGNANRVGNIKHNSINTQRNPFSEDMNRPSHALTEDSEFQPMNSEYKSAAHMENIKYLPNVYEPKSESKKKGLKTCVFLILASVFCVGFFLTRSMRMNNANNMAMSGSNSASQTMGDYAAMTKDYGNKMFRAGQQQAAAVQAQAAAMDKQECLDNVCLAAVLAAVTAFIGMDICGMVNLCEQPGRCCSGVSYDELSQRQKEIYDENDCCWGCNFALRVLTLCINSFTCCQIICRLHAEIDEKDSGSETYYYVVEEPKSSTKEVQPPADANTCDAKDSGKFLAAPAASSGSAAASKK